MLKIKKVCIDLHEFLDPVNKAFLNDDKGYNDSQIAGFIKIYEEEMPDLAEVDIVIAGINEFRGDGFIVKEMLPMRYESNCINCITGIKIFRLPT